MEININTFSQDEINTLVLVNKIVSSFSIFSCICIIIFQKLFSEVKNFILTLVVWLCISNIFYCSTAFYPYNNVRSNNIEWCAIQAFSIITFQYATWMISCLLGYSLFIFVIKKNHFDANKTWYKLSYIIITSIVSLGLASM